MKPKTELKAAICFSILALVGMIVLLVIPHASGFVKTYKEWKKEGFPNIQEMAIQFETITENAFSLTVTLSVFIALVTFILARNLKHLK